MVSAPAVIPLGENNDVFCRKVAYFQAGCPASFNPSCEGIRISDANMNLLSLCPPQSNLDATSVCQKENLDRGVLDFLDFAENEEPPPPGVTTPPSSPRVGRSECMPQELIDMMQPDYCYLCSVRILNRTQEELHKMNASHARKVRKFMMIYCRKNRLQLPDEFRRNAFLKPPKADWQASCKICELKFASKSQVDHDQHFSGICHARSLDGKPSLKAGYYNKFSGKWQKKLPNCYDMQKKKWWKPVPRYCAEIIEIGASGSRYALK
ncbi:unnamed protein product [Notodromas monacha]|uniref:Uncharacterized protein n=1 Tax=Notodromas monacha TaxID=399045 RepID=A0A7R9BP46_9CRUS|nr:unnamed protein product [Notodromas monacha]CAG0918798.1 unnamed protein product [Notodromas monacha]